MCIYECVFALELWNLPVTEAERTIADFLAGEVEDADWSPSWSPPGSRKSGTSLALFPKDTRWCFCALYPLPHAVSSCPSLTSLSVIPTHRYPSPPLSRTRWVGKLCIRRVQIRGFPGSHSICCYLCSPSSKGRGGALLSLPLCLSIGLLAYLLVACTSPPLFYLYPCLRSRQQGGWLYRHSQSLHGWRELVG